MPRARRPASPASAAPQSSSWAAPESSYLIPFIGLTGGIGAGKSTALDALTRLGAACLSTDEVVHELYESPQVRDAVATSEQRAWLEELLWPRVGARMVAWRDQLERDSTPPPAAVVEVPLLFESGMENAFDATIAVIAEEDVRHKRAFARGHQALDERGARQLSQQEKSERATYTVVNDGTTAELERKLSAILDMLHQ